MMIAVLFGCFSLLVLLRVPIAFALVLPAIMVIFVDDIPPTLVVLRMFEGLTPFPILSIPLFYLVGLLCNSGGFTDRIMVLARCVVGGFRAGLAQVNIIASMFFAGISGSSTADTIGIGSVLMPQMLKAGYPKDFTVAVTASSSTMGVIIPPSILMIVYGAFGDVSIGMLFLGGFVPGVLLGLGQMALVYVLSRRYGFGKEDVLQRPRLLPSLGQGIGPMLVPVLIIGGIVGGVFTPTESAAVAVVYILIYSLTITHELTLASLTKLLRDAGKFVALPLLLTGTAAVFSFMLAYYEFPAKTVGFMTALGSSYYAVFFSVVILLIILGCLLDSIPIIIMFLPTIQALGNSVGIHPVHMGVVVVLTLALGLITPPVGVCLLVASKIIDVHPRGVLGMTTLFATVSLVVIILAVFVPDITLFLPRLLMPEYS